MKAASSRETDPARRRCLGCGHPRREHRYPAACTVPKCTCSQFVDLEAAKSAGRT